MKKHLTFALVIALTVFATLIVTAYFATRNTKAAFVSMAYDMEAFNELHRIETWDRIEQLLVKGCNKEALEYIKLEQSLALSSLKWHLDNGAKLERKVEEDNRSIVGRAQSFTSNGKYSIPSCKLALTSRSTGPPRSCASRFPPRFALRRPVTSNVMGHANIRSE